MRSSTCRAFLIALCAATAGGATEGPNSAAEVVDRYLEARGGADRWRDLQALELSGTYAAFSQRAPFTLIRRRGDLYRLDFELLGSPAIRARDEVGPWMLHGLLQPEAGRVDEPYKGQLEREATFGLLLLDHAERGVGVELIGRGAIDGIETYELGVTFTDGRKELWHLDAESYLEVAIDSEVVDLTQFQEPVAQRTFFSDFRPVEGLVLPHSIEIEFGARLESMNVESVIVDPPLDSSRFQLDAGGE